MPMAAFLHPNDRRAAATSWGRSALTMASTPVARWLALLLYLACALAVTLPGEAIVASHRYTVGTTGMFACMLFLWRSWPREGAVLSAVLASVLVRLLFIVCFPASDDLNRYIWEGRIQTHGFNPFTQPPDAGALTHLRDSIWSGINHKSIPTIYWPFAQLTFRVIAAVSPTRLAFKVVMTLFDLATLTLVLMILRRRRLEARHLMLYALNPLVIVFTSGEGHLEAILGFWITASLYAYLASRIGLMNLAIGLAIMTKPSAVFLAPLAFHRRSLRSHVFMLAPLLLAIPYLEPGRSLLSVPYLFATRFTHNGFLYLALRRMASLPHNVVLIAAGIAFAGVLAYCFLLVPSYLHSSRLMVAAFLLCSPAVHPWYFILMSPFVCLFRSMPWLSLQWSALALIFYFHPSAVATMYARNDTLIVFEYALFLAFWIYGRFKGAAAWPAWYERPKTTSVIIPTLNEAARIADCLESVRSQRTAAQIIVVDGGSSDCTRDVVAAFDEVALLPSEPGRGVQVATGVERAAGDVVLVLHADARLRPGSILRMMEALEARPDAVGGAFGAEYDSSANTLKFIRWMNDLRAALTGVSFGDQAQFFRRSALDSGYPRMWLMEDVELSLRLKERGATLFLRRGILSSSRRWMEKGCRGNSIQVLSLVLRYLILRRFQKRPQGGETYYRKYYKRPARDGVEPPRAHQNGTSSSEIVAARDTESR